MADRHVITVTICPGRSAYDEPSGWEEGSPCCPGIPGGGGARQWSVRRVGRLSRAGSQRRNRRSL